METISIQAADFIVGGNQSLRIRDSDTSYSEVLDICVSNSPTGARMVEYRTLGRTYSMTYYPVMESDEKKHSEESIPVLTADLVMGLENSLNIRAGKYPYARVNKVYVSNSPTGKHLVEYQTDKGIFSMEYFPHKE